jgi:hypothetical protein
MIRKEIKFHPELAKAVQEYADSFCEGNFNMAVRMMIKKELKHA